MSDDQRLLLVRLGVLAAFDGQQQLPGKLPRLLKALFSPATASSTVAAT